MPVAWSRSPTPSLTRLVALLITGVLCLVAAAGAKTDEGPELVILPVAKVQTKYEGRNTLLTCRVNGLGAEHVTGLRWLAPNGREIPQLKPGNVAKPPIYTENFFSVNGGMSLIFTTLKTQDEGNYTCQGVYAGGQELSRVVEIRVIKGISWVDAPTEQYPKRGDRYKIKCKVEAEPAPTVDWYKDGQPLGENYRMETDGVWLKNAGPEDDGEYTCRAIVIATGELQTKVIKVQVIDPPSFPEKHRNETAIADKPATLHCQAEGRPPPTYRWISKAVDLNEAGGRFQVDGTTGVLNINPVHPDDDGVFTCRATNRGGESIQRVYLSVLVPPRVATVRNSTAAQGKATELVCEARGRPPPTIEWRRHGHTEKYFPGQQADDLRISTGNKLAGREHPDRTDGTLSWDNVLRSDDGLYACIASNDAGTAEANGHLTVEFPPTFNNTPYNVTWSWDRHKANITCLAESIPNATIHWYFNERDIEKNRESWFTKYGKGPQSWLAIDPSNENRYGAYKCKAINVHGEAEHVITLRKAEKPGGLLQSVVELTTATTIKFKLVGPSDDGGIPMKYYRTRYRKVDELGTDYVLHSWPADSDYTLEGLEPLTRYEFQFSGVNDVGNGPWSATTTRVMPKRSPPEPPPLLHLLPMASHPDKPVDKTDTPVMATYPSHFELKWQIPADNGEPIINYIVSWCKARQTEEGHWVQDTSNRGQCKDKTLTASEHTTSYRLQPLEPDTQYMVHIYATNNIGTSNHSALLLRTPLEVSRVGGGPSAAEPIMSSAALIGTVVVALLVALLLLDLSCFAYRRSGVIAALCERARGKESGDLAGGARYSSSRTTEPRQDETSPLSPGDAARVKRDSSAYFDGKVTTTMSRPIIGKDSAV